MCALFVVLSSFSLPSLLFFVGVRGALRNEATVVLMFVWRKYSKLAFRHTECAHMCMCMFLYDVMDCTTTNNNWNDSND